MAEVEESQWLNEYPVRGIAMTNLADKASNVVFPVLLASGPGAKHLTKPLEVPGGGQCSIYWFWVPNAVVEVIWHQSQAHFRGMMFRGLKPRRFRAMTTHLKPTTLACDLEPQHEPLLSHQRVSHSRISVPAVLLPLIFWLQQTHH